MGYVTDQDKTYGDSYARLIEVFGDPDNPDPLHPDLEASIWESPSGFVFIKHPLVNTIHSPGTNRVVNRQYEAKKAELARAADEGEWATWIWIHERPWRFEALLEVADKVDDEQFWHGVRDVWMDSENIREHEDEWDELLRTDRPGREHMMDDEEREALAALPDEITVYQGHTDERDDGWSWTTNRQTAEWFARRFASMEDGEPLLTTATVKKGDVTAYLLGRSEFEILTAPETVYGHNTVWLPPTDKNERPR